MLASTNPHQSITASIERVINSLVAETLGWTYVYWDDRDENAEFPSGDLIGPMGIGWEEVGVNEFDITCTIALSTVADQGRFRLRGQIDKVLQAFPIGGAIPLFNFNTKRDSGSQLFIHSPRSVLPIASAEQRTIQLVQLVLSTKLPEGRV